MTSQISDPDRAAPATRDGAGWNHFRVGWTVFMVLATSLPYWLNYFSTPAGCEYTWIMPPYPEDSFGYMAWAGPAAHGSNFSAFFIRDGGLVCPTPPGHCNKIHDFLLCICHASQHFC